MGGSACPCTDGVGVLKMSAKRCAKWGVRHFQTPAVFSRMGGNVVQSGVSGSPEGESQTLQKGWEPLCKPGGSDFGGYTGGEETAKRFGKRCAKWGFRMSGGRTADSKKGGKRCANGGYGDRGPATKITQEILKRFFEIFRKDLSSSWRKNPAQF